MAASAGASPPPHAAHTACPGPEGVRELQELYEALELSRAQGVESALRRYRTITPLLGKVEELVAGEGWAVGACPWGELCWWEGGI
jgi:dynein heavy chain